MNSISVISVFLFSVVATAVCIAVCLRFASGLATALPNERSSHSIPTPQIGGVCIFAVLLPLFMGAHFIWPGDRLLDFAVLSACALLCITGVFDDRFGLSPRLRMGVYGLVSFGFFFLCPDLVFPLTGFFPVDFFISGFFLLSFMNITNFMDGIDGIVVVEFVPMLVLLAGGAALGLWISPLPLVPAALCGALLGFILFNRPRARTFLGDGGSVPIGFLIGLALLQFASSAGIVAAVILPLYFVADAAITLFLRVKRREHFWQAHRQHFYQRAIDSGQNIWSILARVGITNLVLCVLAILSTKSDHGAAVPSMCAALITVAWLLKTLLGPTTQHAGSSRTDFTQ